MTTYHYTFKTDPESFTLSVEGLKPYEVGDILHLKETDLYYTPGEL